MNLRDWTRELSDVLGVDTEMDTRLVLDVARVAAHSVVRPAAPLTTYLLGYAAGLVDGDPAKVEELAARAVALAESWPSDGGSDGAETEPLG